LRAQSPEWFTAGKTVVPEGAIDGLNLLWHSDLVVSGGGTMNREAAALGVPVYSIFRGTIGAVDKDLQKQGRLILVESVEDVEQKIVLARRDMKASFDAATTPALLRILENIEEIVKIECGSRE
jgi:predicted glycosyltransferase